MKLIEKGMVEKFEKYGGRDDGGCGRLGGDGGRVLIVGVKLDQQSRELLTWALVKVAQPGDRVVALYVLDASNEEQSTLLALVKTFDTVLAVYEGFCHLKEVDLKMKVSRGSSARKLLVHEAKQYHSATVIVGTSRTLHTIRSPASVAKYCARKLSLSFSVFAVDNGKIVFRREAAPSASCNSWDSLVCESDHESPHSLAKHGSNARKCTLIKKYFGCTQTSAWKDYPRDHFVVESNSNSGKDNPLAIVPFQNPDPSSGESLAMVQEPCHLKRGWPLLRWVFLPRKMSAVWRLPKLRMQHSPTAIHPDEKRINSSQKDDRALNLNGENGAIVLVEGTSASPSRSQYHGLNSFPSELEVLHMKYSSTCRLFTYPELLSATSNFTPDRMIGKGGSSQVFRATLPDGKELAVKILKPSEDVLKEFFAEIEIITTINHKNIISLLGYCCEDNNLILVYDLLSRGSLKENLHGEKKDIIAFGWEERYKVAIGVAEALDHLHNGSPLPVIHRDVKSSNILLSDEFEPQLADFGLASWASNAPSYTVCIDVAGTFGYLAPEYFMHGKVTDKIDVYAFGVVLLELLSGRKPINNKNLNIQESLVMWAGAILRDGKRSQLLDPDLGTDYDHDQIERMVLAATLCIRRDPQFRPGISMILKLLQGDTEVMKCAKHQVNSTSADFGTLDGEAFPNDIQSHLNIAFLDIEDTQYLLAALSQTSPSKNT
ncbi:hypothetical protein Nepgr_009532 [Nepenthes gracilis]|uniref:Protein kinase domain-containing protein n=1 Tax=Nepenthes gracilis TaxID=150966 RepID=A0AAD3XK85_NEPGR|nr:hypothetical protein Nepgr_009532 [Nepenthes gracilis]